MTKEKDKDSTAIEMFVGGLVLDPSTQAPVVVLKDENGEINLPIWIGIAEATSIASAIKQLQMARPLTHDLMYDLFNDLGVKIERIVITELRDSTYYAELVLSHGDKALIIDCRPSDAIALAVRATAPIYVTQTVIDKAKIAFNVGIEDEEGASEGADSDGESEQAGGPSSKDFKNIDKEKWEEILADLDPDDFKYKM